MDNETTLRCYTNGGHQDSHKKGYFPGFFYVWYDPMSMLNILSSAEVRKQLALQWTHLENNKIMRFDEVSSGLYLFKGKHKFMNENIMNK